MKNFIYFILCAFFLAAMVSCKSTVQETVQEPVAEKPVESIGVKTYVNTGVNNATNNISTILLFREITEVTAIHPTSRERFELPAKNYKYDEDSTELKIELPKEIPYSLRELSYHIVGWAADPGVFVLTGIDSKRNTVGVFIEGKKAVEEKDYSYDKKESRITSIVPLNVDADSFQICWATKNGIVSFSNNTQKYKDNYKKLYNEWARSIHLLAD